MRRLYSTLLAAGLVTGVHACAGSDALAPAPSGIRAASGAASGFRHASANGLANANAFGATKGGSPVTGVGGGMETSEQGSSAALARCENHPAYVGGGWVGSQGGTIVAGTVRLIIPPGALTDSTFITATVPEGDNTSVHFEPSGLVLKKSAALVFDAATCDVSAWFPPNVVYFEGGEILEWIDAEYIPHLQTVAAPIDHFSGYALAM